MKGKYDVNAAERGMTNRACEHDNGVTQVELVMSSGDIAATTERGVSNGAFQDGNGIESSRKRTPNRVKTIWSIGDNAASSSTDGSSTERQQWDKPIEFLLSCIAMSVGLGNVWRFPYTAYENGGGAFLIPYLIVLFFLGRPLYFLEMSMGQFSSKSQVKVWRMSPFFKGVGYGSAFGSACVLSYYCSLMALTVYYFTQSFSAVLPWSVCNPEWTKYNVTCINNFTEAISVSNKSIPELYFKIDVLHELNNIDAGIGFPDYRLSLCLLFCWVVVFISLIKGVQSAGKFAYFTALFPYVVLLILLFRGIFLEGAWEGILYFFKPQWSKLLEGKVWAAATAQCFYSLGVGFGSIIMFASYNPFRHNIYRDVLIISATDTATSLLAGCTIFAILGNLAHNLNVEIPDVAGKGPALAFASYPLALSKFEFLPQVFSVAFFLMLFTLGIGSATPMAAGLISIIHDQFPKMKRMWITATVCVVGFLSGLVYVTPGGQWMLDLVDYFGASFVIYVMATFETIGIVYMYGLDNVCNDIEYMLGDKVGKRISFYWRFCWGFMPIVLLAVLTHAIVGIKDGITYEGKLYPLEILVFGWCVAIFAILLIPIFAIHSVLSRKSEGMFEKMIKSIMPAEDWGPSDPQNREGWLEHKKNAPKFKFFQVDFTNEIFQRNEEAPGIVVPFS